MGERWVLQHTHLFERIGASNAEVVLRETRTPTLNNAGKQKKGKKRLEFVFLREVSHVQLSFPFLLSDRPPLCSAAFGPSENLQIRLLLNFVLFCLSVCFVFSFFFLQFFVTKSSVSTCEEGSAATIAAMPCSEKPLPRRSRSVSVRLRAISAASERAPRSPSWFLAMCSV